MSKPIPLRSIYSRVNVLAKITSRHRATVEDLQRYFSSDVRNFGYRRETKDGVQLVNDLKRFIVLGKPGAGKTTFLKSIALQALDGKFVEQRIPIFISLKDWSDSGETLIDFIIREFDICSFPDAALFIGRILSRGKCLLLLDGLDEVSSNIDDVIRQIRSVVDKYDQNQFILSCRIAAYNYCFDRFTDIEIADFDEKQIEAFIHNWFSENRHKGALCWQRVLGSKPILELASTPLLLTMLCLAFDETMDFPSNRAELYKEALDALLKKWDASRNIKREDVYRHLSLRRKEALFSRIAAITFENSLYFMSQHFLENQIASFIENLVEAKQDTLIPDSEVVLKAIEAHHGLFVERAKGVYSFSHLTFQEYFTARYIVENATKGTLHRLVDEHLTDHRWREVFLITTCMLEEADRFLLLMRDKIETLVDKELGDFLVFLNGEQLLQNTVSRYLGNKSIIPACLRALKIWIAWTLDGPKPDTTILMSYALELALAISREESIFESDDPIAVTIRRIEIDAEPYADSIFAYGPYRLLESRLAEYINANYLLVECLNTDCYVSMATRSQLIDGLLRVREDTVH